MALLSRERRWIRRRKSFEGLEPSGEVVGGDEVCEVTAQLIVSLGEETLDGGFFEGFDSCARPGRWSMGAWVGHAVVDVGLGAGELEGVGAEELSLLKSELDLGDR